MEVDMIQNHKNKFTDEELIEAYSKNPKLGLLSHQLGVPTVTLWRRATKLGLTFRNGGRNEKFDLSDILKGKHPQYPTLKLKKRLLKENMLDSICNECGISEWNGKEICLQLDHIDGNSHNHVFENLRLLCPNCHSQTDTYCGRNRNKN